MEYNTSELCDTYTDLIDVVEPMFVGFGGISSFGGEVTTVKCFEDKGLVSDVLESDGTGKVLLIDAGGSMRRAIIDNNMALTALDNNWEGIICYGCVREVDALADIELGIQALGAIPVGADDQGHGEVDVAVNFAGVTFLPEDHIYADSTGIIVSPEPLDIE